MSTPAFHQVLADGIAWVDADSEDMWPLPEACALADHLDGMGYETEVTPA